MVDKFVGPRDRSTARKLLAAAAELGLDSKVVRTTTHEGHGYLVPEEVADLAFADEKADGKKADSGKRASRGSRKATTKKSEDKTPETESKTEDKVAEGDAKAEGKTEATDDEAKAKSDTAKEE